MTRTCVVGLVAVAAAAGLALRLARLDLRPMHHDEANQAVKFGALLERGEYRYDAHDHHGPTLYYLTLPAAALRGQATFASLDERTLRGATVAFGTVTILLLPLLSAGIGRTAVAAGALLMALSPAMTFYSRVYIQEALFACFALGFVIAVGRVAVGGGLAWATLAGVAAGLALATKETSVIVLSAGLASCVVARRSLRGNGFGAQRLPGEWATAVAAGAASAVVVAALFFSSFLAAPAAVIEPLRAMAIYLGRGIEPVSHAQPWHYYLGLLAYYSSGGLRWSEGLVLALAIAGVVAGVRGGDPAGAVRTFWARHLAGYTCISAAVFSAIPYKTPWNLLPFYVGALVLAGIGFSRLLRAASSRSLRGALLAACLLASGHLGWQAWRASVTFASDPRNPYVYAQTVPDAVRMAARIRALAAVHPDGDGMPVAVVAPPHEQWPLPWYLRTMPHVGYWTAPGEALAWRPPVIVTSLEHAAAVEEALGEGVVSEFYGLRPDVLLALHVERGLWDRFLSQAASGAPAPVGVP